MAVRRLGELMGNAATQNGVPVLTRKAPDWAQSAAVMASPISRVPTRRADGSVEE